MYQAKVGDVYLKVVAFYGFEQRSFVRQYSIILYNDCFWNA